MLKASSHLMLLLALALAATAANAATFYVRAGASGNGSDWTNAYNGLPASLQRGATYYVATGNYPAHTFADALPVTPTLADTITIKKATAADHGPATDWQSAYGAGQAVFNSVLHFQRGYYVFDGQVRNESDWFDGASYGFRIAHDNQDQNIVISDYGVNISNVAIKDVYVDAIYQNLPTATTIRRYAVDTDGFDGGTTATNLVFHRMYVRGSNNVWFLRTTDGAVVEYSASDGVASNSANHGEIVNLYYSGNNAIIRYNKWRNAFIGNGGTALVAIIEADGLQFYGNLAYNFQVGDAAVGFDGAPTGRSTSNNRVYNNTFVDCQGAYNGGTVWGLGTNNLTYNNVWVNCPASIGGTHDFNAFSDSNARGEANAQLNVPTSLFVNYAGADYRLTAATNAGTLLATPFNQDLLGTTRGADGNWDRGAYEFGPGRDATAPMQPTGLVVR